ASRVGYLTGDQAISSPELSCFQVIDVMPFSARRLRTYLRQHGIGRLEVKKRGVRLSPEQVLAELSPTGDGAATLMLMPEKKRVLAIVCQRV
ncbi:MAG: SAM-dependent methyltransferase, partial [Planctomycetes bacterium]|nr:SAM-dependent methyltransferase [Planctomycetota bacterium]